MTASSGVRLRRFRRLRPLMALVRAALAHAALVLGASLAIAGCNADPAQGWSTASVYRENIRSVAVPIVENESFVRNVEFDLTDALIKEIESRTPYKVTSRARADSVLAAKITRVELDQLSKSRFTGLGEEVLVAVTIDFEWRHQNTGEVLVDRRSFTGQKLFVPSAPASERVELGRFAVVQQLARDIVGEMEAAW